MADLALVSAPAGVGVALAIVAVQFFALSRGAVAATASGWSATTPPSVSWPICGSASTSAWSAWRRSALPAFRSGDLLARLVHDVDSLQDLLLRVVPPFAIAVLVGAATVALVWWMLPAAGVILLVALLARRRRSCRG